MEEKTFLCNLCEVTSSTTVCEMCGSPILDIPTIIEEKPFEHPRLLLPGCLFQITKEGSVKANVEIIERLRERFDPMKKLVVLVAAGLVGTGKSTWMNALLYKFYGKRGYATFNIGYTAETETEGLWVFPHPLTLSEVPDVQYMLMDMEGMNGIKACTNKEQVEISLRKIYMVGMIVASVFTLHTQFRVDTQSIDLLQNTFNVLLAHRKQLGVEFPRIMLLVKDTNEIKVKSTTDLKSLLRSYGHFDKILDDALDVYPKPPPPSQWISQTESPDRYSALEASDYHKFNTMFLQNVCAEYCKKKPAQTALINIDEFCQMLDRLSSSINDSHFEEYFKGSVEQTIAKIVQPLLEQHVESFEQQSMQLVASLPPDTTREIFLKAIQDLTTKVHQDFFSAVNSSLNVGEQSEYMINAKAQLVIRTKVFMVENMFLLRQKSDQVTSEMEKIKHDNELQKCKAEQAVSNLQMKMHAAQLKQEEQEKKSQELILQMQKDNEEAINQIKKEMAQKMIEIEEKYKSLLDEANKKYDNEKKTLSERIIIEEEKGNTEVATQLQIQLSQLRDGIKDKRAFLSQNREQEQERMSELDFNIGLGYYQKDNYILAKQHFEAAANLGSGQAYYYLGVMSLKGEGVKKDMVKAGKYFLEATNHDYDAFQEYQLLVDQGIVSPRRMPEPNNEVKEPGESHEDTKHHEKTRERAQLAEEPNNEGQEPGEQTRARTQVQAKRRLSHYSVNISPDEIAELFHEENPTNKPEVEVVSPPDPGSNNKKIKSWKIFQGLSTVFKNFWSLVTPLTPAKPVPTVAKTKHLSCKEVVLNLENFGLTKAKSIVTDCEEYLYQSIQNKKPNPHNLTNDEQFAIICYTYDVGKIDGNAENNVYFQLNNTLRSQNTKLKEAWDGYLFHFQAALTKIPSETTVVFRGIHSSAISEILKNYHLHRRIQWTAFTSASRHIKFAHDFAGPKGIILRLSVSTGKSISDYSFISSEDEVIISPNMTFLVVKDLYFHSGYKYIDFVQEEPNSTFVF